MLKAVKLYKYENESHNTDNLDFFHNTYWSQRKFTEHMSMTDREQLNATLLFCSTVTFFQKAIRIFWVFYHIWIQQLNQQKKYHIFRKLLDLRLLAEQNCSTEDSGLENGDIWWYICFLIEIVKEMFLKLIAIVAGFHQYFTDKGEIK